MKRAAARVALFVFAGALVMGADAAGLFQPERPDRPRIPFTPPERPGEGTSETAARRVWFATSDDGLVFTERGEPLLIKAASPDVIVLERDLPGGSGPGTRQGDVLVYAVDARAADRPGKERLARMFSSDAGENWSGARGVEMFWPGMRPKGTPLDPSVVQLGDGRLRMYYYLSGAKGMTGGTHAIGSAISEDGVKFTPEDGHRLEMEGLSAPEVIRLGEEWLMLLSRGGRIVLARSGDGLSFKEDGAFALTRGEGPGAIVLADDNVRILVSESDGVSSVVWNPGTGRIEAESGVRFGEGARDGSVFRHPAGGFVGVFARPAGSE